MEQADLANLRMDQARTAGQDRALAGQHGLDVGRFGETQYQFDVDSNLRQRSLELQKYGIDTNKSIAMAQLEQNAHQFGLEYALRERGLELEAQGMSQQEARFQADLEFRQMQQLQNEQYRRDVFGFEQDEAGRAWQYKYANEGIGGTDGAGSIPGNPGFDDGNSNGRWDFGEFVRPEDERY